MNTLTVTPFVTPANPGSHDIIPTGVMAAQISTLCKHFDYNKALKNCLIEAVNDMYLKSLQNNYVDFSNQVFLTMIDHMYIHYAKEGNEISI